MHKCYAKKTLTYEMAARLVAAATTRANELGAKQSVVVLDEGANLKAFSRMDMRRSWASKSVSARRTRPCSGWERWSSAVRSRTTLRYWPGYLTSGA